MNDLKERFEKQFEDMQFNILEITGFQANPKLAVLAGMSIGYQMGLEDAKQKFLEIIKE